MYEHAKRQHTFNTRQRLKQWFAPHAWIPALLTLVAALGEVGHGQLSVVALVIPGAVLAAFAESLCHAEGGEAYRGGSGQCDGASSGLPACRSDGRGTASTSAGWGRGICE